MALNLNETHYANGNLNDEVMSIKCNNYKEATAALRYLEGQKQYSRTGISEKPRAANGRSRTIISVDEIQGGLFSSEGLLAEDIERLRHPERFLEVKKHNPGFAYTRHYERIKPNGS